MNSASNVQKLQLVEYSVKREKLPLFLLLSLPLGQQSSSSKEGSAGIFSTF